LVVCFPSYRAQGISHCSAVSLATQGTAGSRPQRGNILARWARGQKVLYQRKRFD
jgi:hypothetical protein